MAGIGFSDFLDHFAGRTDPRIEQRLDSPRAEQARRLVEAGRRAMSAPRPTKRAMALALRIFRTAQEKPRPSLLRLVLDSWSGAAPALRRGVPEPVRFLRFEGDCTLELQVTVSRGGRELRGQVTPAGVATEVVVHSGDKSRRVAIEADGTFLMRRVRSGPARVVVGGFEAELDL